MNTAHLRNILHGLNSTLVQQAKNATLLRMVATEPTDVIRLSSPERLLSYGAIYERQGLQAYLDYIAGKQEKKEVEDLFHSAYICWRSLVFLPEEDSFSLNGHVSTTGLKLVTTELTDEMPPANIFLAFCLSVSGLLSGRTAEMRLDLERFPLTIHTGLHHNWQQTVLENVFCSFIFLVRKANGWEDIRLALQGIDVLRRMQREYEETFLEQSGDKTHQTDTALVLVGLYHLAQEVTLACEYLRQGQPGYNALLPRLDRHHEQAVMAFEEGQKPMLAHMADLLWMGCRELAYNAIWRLDIIRLGKYLQQYIANLTSFDRLHPVLELWPGQQQILHQHVFDPLQRAILIEMPTSGGKTLLAKFLIAQTKSLLSDGMIAYVVPTRALVNQVTLDLREDFQTLFRIEQAIPVFELDPLEDRLLRSNIDILVVTPEKLDLLVRSDHPVVKNITLIVVDEAHTVNDSSRGTRLEFLLGTIKRDFANARFLLLSPFLPNAQDFVHWLGEDLGLSLSADWKPNSKLVGAVMSAKENRRWELVFETLNTARVLDVEAGKKITIGRCEQRLTSSSALSRQTALALLHRGSVLILCKGPVTAMNRALELTQVREQVKNDPLLDAVCHYIETEQGQDSKLIKCLRHGIAYHHSGLSLEIRWLIEELIRAGLVTIVCGTTTLAQGMNFPITTVIVETLYKGTNQNLTPEDIWNVAGRAGRTLVDTLGVVAFPTPKPHVRQQVDELLSRDAEHISSQIVQFIRDLDVIDVQFTQHFLKNHANASPLLQFLAHAMRVSGNNQLADEVEDVLRASLAYHQLQKEDQTAARRLITICRSYLLQTREHMSILPLADKTGFATPSVLSLLREKSTSSELRAASLWSSQRLFGEDPHPLAERIAAIADLPEIQLGQKNVGSPFSPERVARILRDWVNGVSLQLMAKRYSVSKPSQDEAQQLAEFSKYLFTTVSLSSWGIGALATVCLGGNEQAGWEEVKYVPSMIYFGVNTREAIMLRMVGVPRVFATDLAQLWEQRHQSLPDSYESIRGWVSDLSAREWQHVLSKDSKMTPEDMQLLWRSFIRGR